MPAVAQLGHAIGAVAGGILGSTVGRGRGNTATTAIGAATGAIIGGNMGAQPNPNSSSARTC